MVDSWMPRNAEPGQAKAYSMFRLLRTSTMKSLPLLLSVRGSSAGGTRVSAASCMREGGVIFFGAAGETGAAWALSDAVAANAPARVVPFRKVRLATLLCRFFLSIVFARSSRIRIGEGKVLSAHKPRSSTVTPDRPGVG